MPQISTARVGLNAQPLAPGPVAGAEADVFTVVNMDTANSVNLGSAATNLPYQLGPLASVTLTAPVWASAATEPLIIGLVPGGGGYSPGSLTITGPVTAEISGPVTVEGTVDIAGTTDVEIQNANINVIGAGGYILPGQYTTLLNDSTTHTVAASAGAGGAGVYATALQNVTGYQSFNLGVIAYCPSQSTASAPLVMPVTVNWYADAAGDLLVETDTYWMWLANSSGAAPSYQLKGGGPCKGAYVRIGFSNLSGTATIDITQITLIGNGRAVPNARFNQVAPYANISSGETLLTSVNQAVIQQAEIYPDGSDGILCNESSNANIVAGDTYWLPLPLYTGPVWCRFNTSVALANDFVICTAAPLLNGNLAPGASSQGCLWNPGNTAGTDYETTLQLGSAPAYAVFKGGASAPTITLEIQGVAE